MRTLPPRPGRPLRGGRRRRAVRRGSLPRSDRSWRAAPGGGGGGGGGGEHTRGGREDGAAGLEITTLGEAGMGPVLQESTVRFLAELRVGDEVGVTVDLRSARARPFAWTPSCAEASRCARRSPGRWGCSTTPPGAWSPTRGAG